MDTITHIALGAAIGTALAGRKIGVRPAAVAGAVFANLPDLDVFWPFDNPVDSFIHHRAATHSLLMQALAAPILGEAMRRLFGALKDQRWLAYAMVFCCLASHSLLDYFTIYGTQLFWPLTREAMATGAIFVIDPLYTLPLLVPFFWAFIGGKWSPAFRRALAGGLALSSLYMAWAHAAQIWSEARANAVLAGIGIKPDHIVATPTPLNTLLWRVIAIQGDRYFNFYMPVLAGADGATVFAHSRNLALGDCLANNNDAKELIAFSHGYFRYELVDGALVWADLRMGLTPNYSFRYVLARQQGESWVAERPRRLRGPRASDGDIDWLLAGLGGARMVRAAEGGSGTLDISALPAPAPAKRAC